MANMSYCRFENTYRDFKDCYDALYDEGLEELSDTERHYADEMYYLAMDFVNLYENNLEEKEDISK